MKVPSPAAPNLLTPMMTFATRTPFDAAPVRRPAGPLGMLAILLGIFLASGTALMAAEDWKGVDMGGCGTPGTSSWKDGVLEISGSGIGQSREKDQLHFVAIPHPGGDVEVIARLASFEGEPKSSAGLMIRVSPKPQASAVSISFGKQDANEGANSFRWLARDPSEKLTEMGGIATRQTPPLWLKIVRLGPQFAVYKSPDGNIWSPLGNTSGGHFAADGPLEVGFFVAGGTRKATATARFDNIQIRAPKLDYLTSWVGGTFGGNRSDRHVSNGASALWTAPDGTCYTNSPWDEAGEASKIYRDGRVVKSFRDESEFFGNGGCGLGTITGNGSQVFLAAGNSVFLSDLLGTGSAGKPLYLTVATFDAKTFNSIVSGMAASGSELFVGDSRANCIRVVRLDVPAYYLASNTKVALTEKPIDTTGVAHAAPPEVYQSQRVVDYTPYKIPGLTPDTTYTVRCHFAEYDEVITGRTLITIRPSSGPAIVGFDVLEAAGGKFRPAVVDVPDAKSDADGNLQVVFEKAPGGNGRIVLCGLEVLAADGTKVFGLNCGGGALEGFEGEAHEIPSRQFAFERPGAMAADAQGNLWIIQRANDHGAGATTITAKYPAAIKCYRPDGTFTGREITDVVNPTALAYDAKTDELLVAENGPDQNIRIYGKLGDRPTYLRSFGIKGGIYAGQHPGQISDPAAGGDARFYGLTGVGVDADSNIYVACSAQGTDLRKFSKDGKLVWMVNGMFFCNTPDVDPDSDGADIYGSYVHLGLDNSKTQAGSEWTYKGYNWDLSRFGQPVRVGNSQAMVRRLGPDRKLMLYTSGQGTVESLKIFRYDGEIAVPSGEARKGNELWIDANGNGMETPDELLKFPDAGGLSSFAVDQKGDIWLALLQASTDPPILRHLRFLGLNEHGGPRYGNAPGEYEDIPFPGPGEKINGWGNGVKVHYDADKDVMILIGPAGNRQEKDDPIQYMARYDNWSTGNREARWLMTLPNPKTDPNFSYEIDRPWGCVFTFSAMDAAGDKIFLSSVWGEVHVFDSLTGERVTVLSAGPEVSGRFAWQDANLGLRAFQRKNGEYLIFTENSGYNAKCNLYRWKPEAKPNTP